MQTEDRGPATSFGNYGDVEQVSQHWFAALFTSSIVYVALAAVAILIGTATKEFIAPEPVEVKFVEKVVKQELPPPVEVAKPAPPPPKMEAKPRQEAPAAAAAIPKNMKVRKLDAPPPAKELVAPLDMPTNVPAEADASLDKGIGVYGEPGTGDPAGLEGGTGSGPGRLGYLLPQGAVAPKPHKSNRQPAYPAAARNSKRAGIVLIKGTVRADGALEELELVRGEEPFAAAAMKAVGRWRYQPALYEGQPISAGVVIEIRFKLKA